MKTEITELLAICKKAKAIITAIEREAKVIEESSQIGNRNLSEIDVSELPLSSRQLHTRFLNVCACNHINTIDDLVKLKSIGFLRLSGVGKTLYTDVKKALRWQYKIKW